MTITLVERAEEHTGRVGIVDAAGEYTYDDLLRASGTVARTLLAGRADLGEARIAFMVGPGFDYVAVLWGIWRAGGIAVPLSALHPVPELEYVLNDTSAEALVTDRANEMRLKPLATARDIWLVRSTEAIEGAGADSTHRPLPSPVAEPRRAMILYTSGTTSRPKGVVTTHGNLRAQIECLVQAWGWRADDHILHVLPLHHTHGIVNALLCALWAGATCEMLPGFDARRVWERFVEGGPTMFMAVPTIYAKLIAEWESAESDERERRSHAASALRLMVSGSAALPASVFERWREITGHALLERYGMTEIGMALSNPLDGERRPGTVGTPLPGVEVRLRDENGAELSDVGVPGEIHVRGPGVFLEYWNRPEATRTAFRADWFCTGDIAVVEDGYYRILGRSSVDIIKTGGYKVSALEIEEALRAHPAVKDCAVVGLEDPEWGERVGAAVVPVSMTSGDSEEALKEWLGERIAPYKLPRRWMFVDELPRNAMGKVTKPAVKELFGAS
ncbi:MAG: acyl-CoA synthetase [Gemmatimonadota bacterium]|nr:acyl-CoA synthetase [Gemmatimonadota bacterium]